MRAAQEFMDQDHPRAGVSDGGRIMLNPGKLLKNVTSAMERVDLDINTPVSIDDDVVGADELWALVEKMRMGPTLVVHVVNTAMRIMSARYPAELVQRPLPPEYDLRQLVQLEIDQPEHDVARAVFNRRTVSEVDLTESDIPEVDELGMPEQAVVFMALFFMCGTKVGAMKQRTGIE